MNAAEAQDRDATGLQRALAALETVVLGKPRQVRLCLTCLLARGHLLIEDVPGVGKTTLAHALAQVLGLAWQRVQFTSDLLPADIIGVSIFDRASQQFTFRQGPIFTQLLLADEVNRASPRTQSALLEAMEERQVSVDLTTYRLAEPFFVVATQNPHEQLGTFPLPESQLDRFLMRVTLGYPDAIHERELLKAGRSARSDPRPRAGARARGGHSRPTRGAGRSRLGASARLRSGAHRQNTRPPGSEDRAVTTRGARTDPLCAGVGAVSQDARRCFRKIASGVAVRGHAPARASRQRATRLARLSSRSGRRGRIDQDRPVPL